MGKKNICPRCGGPLRFDGQCVVPACRNSGADLKTPVVEPPDANRTSDIPTDAPAGNPDSVETLSAGLELDEPVAECPICHQLLELDGQCRSKACLVIQQATRNVGNRNAFSDPPPEEPNKDCIPPQVGDETPADEEPGWDDHGRCLRCNSLLEQGFSHCPKCGLARAKKTDPYAALRNGLTASLPPGNPTPPKSGFQPRQSEYSFVDPDVLLRRRRKL